MEVENEEGGTRIEKYAIQIMHNLHSTKAMQRIKYRKNRSVNILSTKHGAGMEVTLRFQGAFSTRTYFNYMLLLKIFFSLFLVEGNKSFNTCCTKWNFFFC